MTRRRAPQPSCPNEANHVPHPAGYVSHSNWADDALVVAEQQQCPGCGRWALWTPKRPDLRIAVSWPLGNCDWGFCDKEGVAERLAPDVEVWPGEVLAGRWVPVCRVHTGLDEEGGRG